MIVFLTLIYVGLLFLLARLRIIRLNLFWKLSPAIWMLLLFVVLFVPMQWGAPVGKVNIYQPVVEIVPNVSGEVIDVPVTGMTEIKRGDLLFQIDPVPFEIEVGRTQAALADAKQTVAQLESSVLSAEKLVQKTELEIEILKSQQLNSQASIQVAESNLRQANRNQEKAASIAGDLQQQVATAQKELDRLRRLLDQRGAVSESEVDTAQIKFVGLQAELNAARIEIDIAKDSVAKAMANLDVAGTNAEVLDVQLKQAVETDLVRAKLNFDQAKIAAEARVDGVHPLIATAQANLNRAIFELEQTRVTAPSDGYAVGVTLRPGQRVGSLPMRSWMSFVSKEDVVVAVAIEQYALRNIEIGQVAEVTLKTHPGKVFTGKVDRIANINPQGQLSPSGAVADAPGNSQALQFAVVLALDDDSQLNVEQLPAGSLGMAAIYTGQATPTHIIRKVMIRMQAWQNYVLPY